MKNTISVKKGEQGFSEVFFTDYKSIMAQKTASRRVIVITDTNLWSYYGAALTCYEHIVIGVSEKIKTLQTVESIYRRLIEMGADRTVYLVGFGGGIVTDITGFVASTYMRGVDFGFVATTLLAQVDASVGGKNGVNVGGYKNMTGVFCQPNFVVCDSDLLNTLPEREFRAGLSEIIKAGLICNSRLFGVFEKYTYDDLRSDKELLTAVVQESVAMKADIVSRDEHENSERKKLNLGHTFAHAIEKCSSDYLHGEAVAIGICIAAQISRRMGRLDDQSLERIRKAIASVGLPTQCDIPMEELTKALRADKKRDDTSIYFILITSLGSCEIHKMSFAELDTYTR